MELYYDRFCEEKPAAVELEFRIPILDPATGFFVESKDIVGKMDAIFDHSVAEIKTTGRSPVQREIDSNLQLTFYSLAYRFLYREPEQKIKVVSLVKTKEPKLIITETKRTERDYTRLITLIARVICCIDQRIFYPNPIGGFGCFDCNYTDDCRDKWPLLGLPSSEIL